jgi:CheY-like chemotaxis protein
MSRVLLVEDDVNLREIFEMRLQAEGYETLSASDGEEALVVATKEKPDLIIADVMMPKLSGFEMLETLRAAPEMSSTKVIMMTALGQDADRARGDKLGVVKYLVKSQVTLEDFVRVVHEVLPPGGQTSGPAAAADSPKVQVSSSTNNKQESELSMQDDNTNPATPPAGDQPAGANPVGGDMPAGSPGQMGTGEEQDMVNKQVDDAMAGSAPADPAAPPAGGSDAGSMGDTPKMDEPKPEEGSPTPPAGV